MVAVNASDLVRDTIDTWSIERPDLDFNAMATCLRLARFQNEAIPRVEAALTPHGINLGEFDVLATLRRRGAGAELNPGTLARAAMVSPAGMTNRLDRLHNAGLINRRTDPDDRRAWLISLTVEGRRAADAAIEAVSDAQRVLLDGIAASERATLDRLFDKLLRALGEHP